MQNQGNTGNSQSLPQHPPPEVMMPPVYASLPPQPPPAKPLDSGQYINSESFINTELIVVAVVLVGVMLATQSSYMSQLLEQIDMLITSLQDEGINISRIPHVDSSSSIKEIESVHKILRLKNDRNRYCSFAEEGILAGAHTLEWLFDGKKTYMGRRPDLRGWSATVNIKLRRMRYDTSTVVSNLMQENDIGSGWRIGLELIPSLFLFSRMKGNQQYNNNNTISNEEMNTAMNKIRDMDDN